MERCEKAIQTQWLYNNGSYKIDCIIFYSHNFLKRILLLYNSFYDFSSFLLGPMMINMHGGWNEFLHASEGGRLQKFY